ncbi:MAG TPA: response regulator [Blastocatellia bacterium]|nr:response regulator [Blastocatellia bacterium]
MRTKAAVSGTRQRILYIEQSEECRDMLTTLLDTAGYAVATAATATEGMILARRERFDLLILESRYSDDHGANLCRQIRAFDSVTPILFYSSSAYDHDVAAGMAAGAQGYLTKPEDIRIIEQTIAGLLASTTTQAYGH